MKTIFAFVALTAAFIAPSYADAIYTTSADFQKQLQAGAYTEAFSATVYNEPASKSYSNKTFTYTVAAAPLFGNGTYLGAADPHEAVTITFTGAAVNAIGANFYNTTQLGVFKNDGITITLSNGQTTTFAPTTVANSYRGFTSDVFITSLTITNAALDRYVGLDNLTVGRAIVPAAVPEPASLAIMGLGMFGLMAMRRRRNG